MAFVAPIPALPRFQLPRQVAPGLRPTPRTTLRVQNQRRTLMSATAPKTPGSAVASAPSRPSRVVRSPLPRLLVYDHCPYCVRVRHVLGVKNVKYELVWLANDDVETPTRLVGRKVVPIFQPEGAAGHAVMESMDICRAVDADPAYGPPNMFRMLSDRADIAEWMSGVADARRRLTGPRNVIAPFPEFVFEDGREAFIRNHPLQEPSAYSENLADSAKHIAALAAELPRLDEMIHCEFYCTEGGLSLDDVDLFPRLRELTIVRDLELPAKMRKYVEFHSQLAEVPLYDRFAL